MLCPHCQAPNADEARFCGACGKATSATEPVTDPTLGEAPAMIGREIAGRFRITSKLGEGGMGTVYQAEQMSLKRTVALKLLRPDVASSALLLRRFNAEAEAVAKLKHPNTVQIYDFGQDRDGTLFISMELIEGHSLRRVIHAEAPLPLRRALAIAAQVAASLSDAHARTVIHRDLKPDNVMLTDRGRARDHVTVLDFGIAKLHDRRTQQAAMTQAGDMLGTPQYMAPEQIRAETIDGRTDVYALGCMLYEMITGRLPFEGPTIMSLLSKHLLEHAPPPSQRRPDLGLGREIDELVMTAMAKDPAQRPPTMDAYAEQIAALLATLPLESGLARSGVGSGVGSGLGSGLGSAVRSDTPAPPSHGWAPPTPPPPHPPAPVYSPAAPYVAPPRPPAASGGGLRIAAIIAGVLAAGGAAAGVYALTRSKGPAVTAPVVVPVAGGGSGFVLPTLPMSGGSAATGGDPWGGGGGAGTAPATAATPTLPAGARLLPPPGFNQATDTDVMKAIVDPANQVAVLMVGIEPGIDDPETLGRTIAPLWGATYEGVSYVEAHGAQRWVIGLSGMQNGTPVRYLGVGFLGGSYRIGVVFVVRASEIGNPQFAPWLRDFLERNVVLPGA